MTTARLIPSEYYLSSTQYLSVSDASNMYANTDSTTYATVTNSRSSTSSYYIYVRGFDFDTIPSSAIVNSFTVKLKAKQSGVTTSTNYKPYLANGTSTINGSCDVITTTEAVHTFTGLSADWSTIKGYGDNFGIRINCRRASSGTTSHMYIYGAEIEVNYTIPTPRTITATLTGDGDIMPSGTTTAYDGDSYTQYIQKNSPTQTMTVTKDGVDITSQLVHVTTETDVADLGTYTLVSGGFNGSGASYFQGIVGNGVDATKTTSNYYSSGQNTQAVFTYNMGMHLESSWIIKRIWCEVNGHAESTSSSSEYMCVQLKCNGTALSEQINFKDIGTSNTTITLEASTLPSAADASNIVLECTLGYYGGAINGATIHVEYESGHTDYYSYTYIVSGDSTFNIVIGDSSDAIWHRINDGWVLAEQVYIKQNGTWALQSDLTSVFDPNKIYIRG